ILSVARGSGCDLIVMGSHGRTGLRRTLLGSVAEAVLRRAVCPVLTVRPLVGGAAGCGPAHAPGRARRGRGRPPATPARAGARTAPVPERPCRGSSARRACAGRRRPRPGRGCPSPAPPPPPAWPGSAAPAASPPRPGGGGVSGSGVAPARLGAETP